MDISKGDQRFLTMAWKIAKKSNHSVHQLGAVVVRGGAVISLLRTTPIGANMQKFELYDPTWTWKVPLCT